jgi:NADH-quinone oxidoreductase subunit N
MRFPDSLTRHVLQALPEVQGSLASLLSECWLAGFFVLLLILGLFRKNFIRQILPFLAATAFLGNFIYHFFQAELSPILAFHQSFLTDGLARYTALLFSIAGIFTVLLTRFSSKLRKAETGQSEYYAFLVLLVLGLNLMVKSANLLLLFLSIETVSIASYFLTLRLRENKPAAEAALKYLLFGAVAAGVMLYGMSFLYGFTRSLQFAEIQFWQKLALVPKPFLTVIFVLTLAGFLFKLAAFPFQFWAPDVYQGAPTPVVAFFSTAPKAAAIIVLIRFSNILNNSVLSSEFSNLLLLLGGIALLTMVVGNFTALRQTNLKRLLGYSSVAHAGLLLAALLIPAVSRETTILFYLTIMLFGNFGLFLIAQLGEEDGNLLLLKDWEGFGRKHAFLAICATVFMISLTGLPPTAGFTAKLLVFSGLWENYAATNQTELLILLIAGLIFTAVALFYYLKLPFYMFFRTSKTELNTNIATSAQAFLLFFLLTILFFFFKADWLLEFIQGFLGR